MIIRPSDPPLDRWMWRGLQLIVVAFSTYFGAHLLAYLAQG